MHKLHVFAVKCSLILKDLALIVNKTSNSLYRSFCTLNFQVSVSVFNCESYYFPDQICDSNLLVTYSRPHDGITKDEKFTHTRTINMIYIQRLLKVVLMYQVSQVKAKLSKL